MKIINDDDKTKPQLISELSKLRRRVDELEKNLDDYKRIENELRTLSFTDELTGLYNRRGFFTLAEQQLKMATRLKRGVLILYADIDNLKTINDAFGHQEGNTAIIDTANILKSTYRDSDIIARIGGDEFVVFPVGTTEDNVDKIISRLQNNIDIHNAKRASSHRLTLSFGITKCAPDTRTSLESLLVRADKLMYRHKKLKKKD